MYKLDKLTTTYINEELIIATFQKTLGIEAGFKEYMKVWSYIYNKNLKSINFDLKSEIIMSIGIKRKNNVQVQ